PELIDAGIDSFKIEGRMKTALYVATVARTYRKAIDDYFESKEKYLANMEWYKEEIAKCTYRHFSTGFYFGKPSEENQVYDSNTYVNEYIFLGSVERAEGNKAYIEQKNKFLVGDEIEIMKPNGENKKVKVLSIQDEEGNEMESCPHSRQKLCITLSEAASAYDILRVKGE
ncbi:MAG: U32 family peptidase C-terminal domain-containing protein, partial [Lachnospiraceae bacterium]|nr:U32 family peptidase C-terminal domain-containing protein [Lachnospiraceae bacterium]